MALANINLKAQVSKDTWARLLGIYPELAEINIKRITSFLPKGETEIEKRTLISQISTSMVDRDKEVVVPGSVQMEEFRENPAVMWSHQWDEIPIGNNLWTKTNKTGIVAKTLFGKTEDAEKVWQAYISDPPLLRGWSIGFIPLKGHKPTPEEVKATPAWAEAEWVHDDVKLIEYSAVAIPANAMALTKAMDLGLEFPDSVLEEFTSQEEPEPERPLIVINTIVKPPQVRTMGRVVKTRKERQIEEIKQEVCSQVGHRLGRV